MAAGGGILELAYGVKFRNGAGDIEIKRFNTSGGRTRWIEKQGAGFRLISFINPAETPAPRLTVAR